MNAKLRKRKAARAGRPRKQGVERYPSGQIVHRQRGETQEQILATGISQPHRVGQHDPLDRNHGSALGRLYVAGKLTKEQLHAGIWYAGLSAAYRREVLGLTIRSKSATLSERVATSFWGASNDNAPTVDIARLRDKWTQVQGAIAAACPHYHAYSLLLSVCTYDDDPREERLPLMRLALDAIGKCLSARNRGNML